MFVINFVLLLQTWKGEHILLQYPASRLLSRFDLHVGEVTGYNLQAITKKKKLHKYCYWLDTDTKGERNRQKKENGPGKSVLAQS